MIWAIAYMLDDGRKIMSEGGVKIIISKVLLLLSESYEYQKTTGQFMSQSKTFGTSTLFLIVV